MANALATPNWVIKSVMRGFKNSVVFIANMNRTYDDSYMQAGAKVGYTVQARLPQRFQVTDGQALQPQPLYDALVPITLTNQKNVAFSYSTADETMIIQDVKSRYVQKAGNSLANAADILAYQAVYRDIWNAVGTPGTTPSTIQTYLNAMVKLNDNAVEPDGRVAVLDTLAMATIAGTTSTFFNSKANSAYTKGQFAGPQLGFDKWAYDQNRPNHTTGTFTASTPVASSANQTGATINSSGWASGATSLKKGDIITFAGVNQVNPESYADTGRLQQFTLTADISDTSGSIALPISPSIITSGQLQTVSASPANNAAITVWSANPVAGTLATTSSPVSMLFHPDAFAFVSADLVKPGNGATSQTIRSQEYGMAIRWVQQYQIGTDQNPSRLDILIGAATLQPRMAVRVQG